jgi:diguanylate cyclase (GGDEF)-like protein
VAVRRPDQAYTKRKTVTTVRSRGTAVLILLLVVYAFARRSARKSAQGEVNAIVTQLTSRVDELATDLQRALEKAESEGRRGRYLGDLSVSIDLDEVLARTVQAASGLRGVEAALVSVNAGEERPIVAATGIPLEEAERQSFAAPPDGDAQAVLVRYRHEGGAEGRIQSALAYPLAAETGELGWLAVYSRSSDMVLEDAAAPELEEIALRAGPALANALRFREARRLADLDALTGLHNRRYFHESLQRECARAQRYGRRLALVVLDLDDFKAINERIGHLAGDGVLAEAAERMQSVVRAADIPCRVGGDEFAVILPESGIAQADQLYRRIDAAISARPIGQVQRLTLSAGVAELNENDDARLLFERADEALYRAKEAGKSRIVPSVVPAPEPHQGGASSGAA